MRTVTFATLLVLLATTASPSMGATILPEDDATWRGGTRQNNASVYGLFTRASSQNDRAYVEFVIGGTPATSATLKLYNYWSHATNFVNQNVRIRTVTSSDAGYVEWTDTAGPAAPSGTSHETTWPIVVDSFLVNNTPQWYTFDVTSFYNDNLGEKVTLSIRSISGTGDGPIFEDKEGTGYLSGKVGSLADSGPRIEWLPEPASALLLLAGSVVLFRRRVG